MSFKENPEYSLVINRAYAAYKGKLSKIIQKLRLTNLYPAIKFWLLFLCYVRALYTYYFSKSDVTDKKIADKERRICELLEDYYVDFVLPYTFVKKKSHVMSRGTNRKIVNAFSRLIIKERGALYSRYKCLRGKLREEGFPFDLSRPVVRQNFRKLLGKTWDSIILVIYPESRRLSASLLDEHYGRQRRSMRYHTTIYVEILVSQDRSEFLFFLSKGSHEWRAKEEKALARVLNEVLRVALESSQSLAT